MFPPLMFFLLLFGAAFNVIIDYFDQLSEDDERQSKFPMYMADTCVLLMLLCFFEVYKAPEKHLTNRKPTRSKLSKKQLKKQDRRRKSKIKKDVPMVVVYADAASLIESWKNVCHLSSALSQNVMQWVYCNFGFSDDSGGDDEREESFPSCSNEFLSSQSRPCRGIYECNWLVHTSFGHDKKAAQGLVVENLVDLRLKRPASPSTDEEQEITEPTGEQRSTPSSLSPDIPNDTTSNNCEVSNYDTSSFEEPHSSSVGEIVRGTSPQTPERSGSCTASLETADNNPGSSCTTAFQVDGNKTPPSASLQRLRRKSGPRESRDCSEDWKVVKRAKRKKTKQRSHPVESSSSSSDDFPGARRLPSSNPGEPDPDVQATETPSGSTDPSLNSPKDVKAALGSHTAVPNPTPNEVLVLPVQLAGDGTGPADSIDARAHFPDSPSRPVTVAFHDASSVVLSTGPHVSSPDQRHQEPPNVSSSNEAQPIAAQTSDGILQETNSGRIPQELESQPSGRSSLSPSSDRVGFSGRCFDDRIPERVPEDDRCVVGGERLTPDTPRESCVSCSRRVCLTHAHLHRECGACCGCRRLPVGDPFQEKCERCGRRLCGGCSARPHFCPVSFCNLAGRSFGHPTGDVLPRCSVCALPLCRCQHCHNCEVPEDRFRRFSE